MSVLRDRSFMIFKQNTLCRAFEIVVLPALQGPHEGRQPSQPHADRNWNQEEEVDHGADPRVSGVVSPVRTAARGLVHGPRSKRKALATTATDDNDIATAAISGVT